MYEDEAVGRAIESVRCTIKLPTLKKEQETIIRHIVNGNNCFVVLPTGFGKSLNPDKQHLAVVISPLKSLVFNQVEVLKEKGVKCFALTGDTSAEEFSEIEAGKFDVLLTSPEMILSEKGLKVINEREFKKKVCLLAFDESHCITEWGDEFRPKYKEVSRVRSYLTNAPVLMLTATTTEKIMTSILETLMLKHHAVEVVALVPDRPNIRLNVETAKDFERTLEWYVTRLRTEGKDTPKAIIYCKSLKDVSEIYTHMMDKVGDKAWLSKQRRAHMKLIDMYHGSLLTEDQKRITSEFPKENSNLRCVIATVAFGLGVDVPDVRYVFHWGPSKSPLQYWQEIGRCSRDGEAGECYMYVTPRSLDQRRLDETMSGVIRSTKCLRVCDLEHLAITGMDVSRLDALQRILFPLSLSSMCVLLKMLHVMRIQSFK